MAVVPPSELSGPPQADAELAAAVRQAQVLRHLRSLGLMSAASLGSALLAVWVLDGAVGRVRLLLWLLALVAVLLLRWALTRRHMADADRMLTRLRLLGLLHGGTWGCLAWLPATPLAPEPMFTLALLLGGVAASGMTLALVDSRVAAAFVLPVLLPLGLQQLQSPSLPLPVLVVGLAMLAQLALAVAGATYLAGQRRRQAVAGRLAEAARIQQAQQAEALMRRVFDHVGEGLCLFDAQWRLQAWNERMFELLELDLSLARTGTPLRDCLLALARRGAYGAGLDAAGVEAAADTRLAQLTRPGPDLWQRTRPDGRTLELRRSLMPDGGMTLVCVDTTERRASEQALVENRRMLSLLLENTEEGFWFIDNTLITTDANRAMCRMLQIEREALIGRSIFEFVDADNEAIFRRQVVLRAQGQAGSYEIALRRLDGSLVHCYNNATPIYDATGAKIGAVGLFSDISAQKRAAAELQRTSELLAAKSRVLESTLENLSQGVMSVAPDGRIEAWNQRLLDLAQLPESLLQRHPTLREVIEWQLAQGLLDAPATPPGDDWYGAARRYAGGDDSAFWDAPVYQRERADGRVVEVQLHRAPDGAQVRTYSDVTATVRAQRVLRESESRFRAMADAAPALIWQGDAQGRPSWFNQTWLRCIGRTMDDALAAGWRERIHADDLSRCQAAYEQAAARREPYDIEFRVLAADGSERWIADNGIPHVDAEGRFDGFISYGWDITARKAAEGALIAARDEAERANRAKSEFLSRMSHELRTPLNAVLGFAQLIEHDPAEPPRPLQRERVQQIQRGGAHLLQLINEVLDLARIESGALTLQLEAVDVDAVAVECRRLVEPMARQQGVDLSVDWPEAGVGRIHTDATRLRQVLLNLLSNAIKYNRRGGRVQLRAAVQPGQVHIEVADTGPGLTAQQQQRLFQAFERLGADRGAVEGTGIGLALSKSLIDLMHGRIGVHSVVGEGSTFWIELPVGSATADLPLPGVALVAGAADGGGEGEPGPAERPWTGPLRHVLYIEDNPVNQIIVESMLAYLPGLVLHLASEPEQGLQMASDQRPDLVLLDIQLPRLSGFEVLQRLRAAPRTRAIPVIAVSANAMPEDVARARAAGFDDYLTKPLDLDRLLATVSARLAAPPAGSPPAA